MAKRVFLYAPGDGGPERPGVLLDLGSPEHAASVRRRVAEIAAWMRSPETLPVRKALERAPRAVRDGALRPELNCFWAASAECPWAAEGQPLGPDGRLFDPACPQSMDGEAAMRLFGIRPEDCAPCGSDDAGAVFEDGAVCAAVRRAPEEFEDAWIECRIPAAEFEEALAPLLDGVPAEEDVWTEYLFPAQKSGEAPAPSLDGVPAEKEGGAPRP